jgi:hypothetical protein
MKLISFILIIIIVFYCLQKVSSSDIQNFKQSFIEASENNNFDILNIFTEDTEIKEKKVEISDILTNISNSEKLTLSNVIEKWSLNKDTIDKSTEELLIFNVKKILDQINTHSESKFYVKDIDNVYVMKDDDNNYRAILNTFIYNIRNYHTVKVVIDYVMIDNIVYVNYIDIDGSSIKTMTDRYDFKWKSSGILLNYNTFDNDSIKIIDDYYRKTFSLIKYDKNDQMFELNNQGKKIKDIHKIFVPVNPSHENPLFCDKTTYDWNKFSIPQEISNNCQFNKRSITTSYEVPQPLPGVMSNNVDSSTHEWLFDPNEIIV